MSDGSGSPRPPLARSAADALKAELTVARRSGLRPAVDDRGAFRGRCLMLLVGLTAILILSISRIEGNLRGDPYAWHIDPYLFGRPALSSLRQFRGRLLGGHSAPSVGLLF